MKKRMKNLAVTTEEDGNICITQNDAKVSIHPDQVDILIKWLNEAKEESK